MHPNGPILGTHPDATARRDAVHVAVAPVEAAVLLLPGQRVGIADDGRAIPCGKPIGVVDPFLADVVRPGQRFWLCLFPNTVTSLRHDWTHPAFSVATGNACGDLAEATRAVSEEWLRDFAEQCGMTYQFLIGTATKWLDRGEIAAVSEDARDTLLDNIDEFWTHFNAVTGRSGESKLFFGCAC